MSKRPQSREDREKLINFQAQEVTWSKQIVKNTRPIAELSHLVPASWHFGDVNRLHLCEPVYFLSSKYINSNEA